MKMLLQQFINKHKLCTPDETVLIAVSGGIDSMCLLHLMQNDFKKLAVAHCNFTLRGADSDADELLVKQYCQDHQIPVYTKRFNTIRFADENKISIQEAARKLRYEYFQELTQNYGYNKIATAHHKDDVVETFLINLTRGTGIAGLSGIPMVSGNIIRPLLFASRNEIETYILKHQIPYREDASNSETKYTRNKIRHHIIPLLTELNPAFADHVYQTAGILKDINNYLEKEIEQNTMQCIEENGSNTSISIDAFLASPQWMQHKILAKYGFNIAQVQQVVECCKGHNPGKEFFTDNFVLLIDRTAMHVKPNDSTETDEYIIKPDQTALEYPVRLKLQNHIYKKGFSIPPDTGIACIDKDKLEFPLKLRKWHEGDYFYPLGLNARKKLSDFFTDIKLNRWEKQNTWLLTSGNDIVWVVGYRIDHRFRITATTQTVLQISLAKNVN